MNNEDTLFIVIPTYGELASVKRCVDSISESTYTNVSIIIIDHGDHDKNDKPDWQANVIYLRENDSNWWTGAVNIGIKYAIENNAGLIMLMNDDCTLLPDTIGKLLSCKETLSASAIVAPIQTDPASHHPVHRVRSCFLLGFPTLVAPTIWPYSQNQIGPIKTRLILGGRGVIIPASVFKSEGFFDEVNLPHYGADHDFYIRCRKNGIPLFVCPQSTIVVDPASTSSAASPGQLSVKEFIATFHNRKSHRNIPDLVNLYKKQYPIKHLYIIGVTLNILRYIVLYSVKRVLFILRQGGK